MRSRVVRHAGRFIGLIAVIGAPGMAYAQDVQTGMTISVGGSAESNPYNEQNAGGVAVAGTLELRPTISVRDETTTANLGGYAQFRQFLRRYGLEDNYGANAGISSRVSERLTLRGTSFFSYNEGGPNGYGGFARSPNGTPGTSPNPIYDPTLLGQRTRFTSFGSGVGADMQVDAYSNVSLDLEARALRFQLQSYNDYNSYSAEMHYSRTINERWSVGLIGVFSKTNYLDFGQGDATTSNVMASVDGKLGARWTVSLSGGAAFTNIEGRAGRPAMHFTSVSGRMRVCWKGEFSSLCVSGDRSPQPAAEGSVRVSDTFMADYTVRLSERENFSLSGSYARTGRGRGSFFSTPPTDFLSAYARYDNQFAKRVGAFATANVSRISTPGVQRGTNVGGAVGLQIRLGAAQ